MAACWRVFDGKTCVTISTDASRLGMRAEETVTYAATDGATACWLPPQVSVVSEHIFISPFVSIDRC